MFEATMKLSVLCATPEDAKAGLITPPPTNAERLRQIADSVTGDYAFILAGILRSAAEELESAGKDAARWQHWKKWWLAATNEGRRLPDDVFHMLDGLGIDDAMDESIDAARLAGKEG